MMIGSASNVRLNTQYQYHKIDDTLTEKAYQINNWIQDSIKDGINFTELPIMVDSTDRV